MLIHYAELLNFCYHLKICGSQTARPSAELQARPAQFSPSEDPSQSKFRKNEYEQGLNQDQKKTRANQIIRYSRPQLKQEADEEHTFLFKCKVNHNEQTCSSYVCRNTTNPSISIFSTCRIQFLGSTSMSPQVFMSKQPLNCVDVRCQKISRT